MEEEGAGTVKKFISIIPESREGIIWWQKRLFRQQGDGDRLDGWEVDRHRVKES